ncbi:MULTISPECIES: hypothetical protein [Azotobacter]|uniref:hypothetical protein n=1 Tax=Azotobacter TaxID=352 RepID=UPI0005A2F9E7|nr:hypothetical protein [Azotobacter vinelandii]
MNMWRLTAAVIVASAITALGVMACVWLAKLLVPAFLIHKDSAWFLPTVLALPGLSAVLLVFGKWRAKP